MTDPVAIGIIGGGGWLGRAVGRSMLSAGFVEGRSLILSGRSGRVEGFGEWPDVRCTTNNRELAERADIVMLSVRPAQFGAVEIDARNKLVISLMAGISVDSIRTRTGADRVVRAMANAAAEIGRSYTPWFAADGVTPADKAFVQALFETCGEADQVSREADIDTLTALTGAGPAWPALLAQAMLAYAEAKGLPAGIARRAVDAIVAGASQLVATGEASPREIVQTFLNYQGTTAAGLQMMINSGFIDAVQAGLDAAATAAAKMSDKGGGENGSDQQG